MAWDFTGEYYVSALAAGGGDGSVATPWTFAEAVAAINAGTVANGYRVNLKADGIYEVTSTVAITSAGTHTAFKALWGYTSTVGDGGMATIKMTAGSGYLFQNEQLYWHTAYIIFDQNDIGTGGSSAIVRGRQIDNMFFNCKVMNGKDRGWWAAYCVNCCSSTTLDNGFDDCYAHFCLAEGSSNNGFYASSGGNTAIYCISKGNLMGYASNGSKFINCIADGNTNYGFRLVRGDFLTNCSAINNGTGYFFFYNTSTPHGMILNCHGYGNTSLTNQLGFMNNVDTSDPGYNNTTIFDYTRTNNNLDGLGYGFIGCQSFDYKTDMAIGRRLPAAATYADATDVRDGTDRGDGTPGTLDLPAVADVQESVTFDGATKTGTFVSPAEADTKAGVEYGAAAEFTGTLIIPNDTPPTFAGIVQLEAVGGGCLRLKWNAATGTFDSYAIYIKDTNATGLFTSDTYLLTKLPNDVTEYFIRTEADGVTFLQNTKTYYVGIRALNYITYDTNEVSLSAVITGDGSTYVKTPKIGLNI